MYAVLLDNIESSTTGISNLFFDIIKTKKMKVLKKYETSSGEKKIVLDDGFGFQYNPEWLKITNE